MSSKQKKTVSWDFERRILGYFLEHPELDSNKQAKLKIIRARLICTRFVDSKQKKQLLEILNAEYWVNFSNTQNSNRTNKQNLKLTVRA